MCRETKCSMTVVIIIHFFGFWNGWYPKYVALVLSSKFHSHFQRSKMLPCVNEWIWTILCALFSTFCWSISIMNKSLFNFILHSIQTRIYFLNQGKKKKWKKISICILFSVSLLSGCICCWCDQLWLDENMMAIVRRIWDIISMKCWIEKKINPKHLLYKRC